VAVGLIGLIFVAWAAGVGLSGPGLPSWAVGRAGPKNVGPLSTLD